MPTQYPHTFVLSAFPSHNILAEITLKSARAVVVTNKAHHIETALSYLGYETASTVAFEGLCEEYLQ